MLRLFVLINLLCSLMAAGQVSSLFNKNRPRSMAQRWELDSTSTGGTFVFTPYKPVYFMPARWSSNPNNSPYSGNPSDEYVVDNNMDLNHIEAKLQISFKIKILQGIVGNNGDLWVGYTQKSNWQIYNKTMSRPFRETNYEPEAILDFATNFNVLGFKSRLAGISFTHQSNGRDTPLSRSWNRIIGILGFEKDNWEIYIRPWYEIKGKRKEDDNPDIEQYIGYGDATVIYAHKRSTFTFSGSTNFSFAKNFRGYVEGSWSYRINGNLKGYLQVTHGYGETLIDYNNRQTTIGLGVSLVEWL